MSVADLQDNDQTLHSPAGHVIGFVNSQEECDAVTRALTQVGIAIAKIKVLHGQNGIDFFARIMYGSLWGEEVERVMKTGEEELHSNHFVLFINAEDRDEGLRIAKTAESHGGHDFTHFGTLTDERLTQ